MGFSDRPVGSSAKRALDIVGALAAIVLFGPLMFVIALLVKLDGGPAFFGHKRVGFRGKPFKCLKFRSMVVDAEERLRDLLANDPAARQQWELDHKLDDDPRITPLGKFLRATSLDELPQFFNVLVGEMSLVGPRPITEDEIVRYGEAYHYYSICRPGITGIWQVSGRSDISYGQRVAFDRGYANSQSLLSDLHIMFRTLRVVLDRTGAR